MSFVPNFTASESLASPSQITLTDTSTGADAGITARLIYCRLADGTYLVQDGTTTDYEVWPLGDTSITLDILDKSQAVEISVKYLTGSTIGYTKTILWGFDLYDYVFAFEKIQVLTSKPKLIDNPNFLLSMMKLNVNLFCEETAIEIGDDIYSAQAALDRNYQIISNLQYFL